MVAALLDLDEGAGAPFQAADKVGREFPDRHDIGDLHRRAVAAEAGRIQFLLVAENAGHLRHGGEGFRVQLRGATGDDDPRPGVVARNAADGLARLPFRFGGHRAGIDDDGVV